jgi:hypothetical protein
VLARRATTTAFLVALGLAGCSDTEEPKGALDGMTCASLVKQVIAISAEKTGNDPKVIAVYKPTEVLNKIAEYKAGTFTIPAGKNKVDVITCTGSATADTGGTEESPITYGAQVDVNGDTFIHYEDAP